MLDSAGCLLWHCNALVGCLTADLMAPTINMFICGGKSL